MNKTKNTNPLSKWYYKNWFIGILYLLWPLYGIPLVIGIVLSILKGKCEKKIINKYDTIENLDNQISNKRLILEQVLDYEQKHSSKSELLSELDRKIENKSNLVEEMLVEAKEKAEKEYENIITEKKTFLNDIESKISEKDTIYNEILKNATKEAKEKYENIIIEKKTLLNNIESKISEKDTVYNEILKNATKEADEQVSSILRERTKYLQDLEETKLICEKNSKTINTQEKKLAKIKSLYKSIEYALTKYTDTNFNINEILLPNYDIEELEELSPTVTLKLHYMDVRQLRKSFKDNEKIIEDTLCKYESRYTTKANVALYKLMVIALKAELQNILYNLKYEKLDKSINDVKITTEKYLRIASDGNQNIAPTLIKFIGEIEYLFINAIKIEYEYYVNKEKQKAEQAAIREQMKQEAEERKVLEQQQKQVEKEEEKYILEIQKVQEQLSSEQDNDKLKQLEDKMLELQNQLNLVEDKKEDIINRQNGKAGNVYIISNIGSFGENVFKIGMTRRLDPMERVKELSSASVPFPFDVHSFIFSDDAVSLEQKLHNSLNDKRVNKVNLRKEYFKVSLDEIENLVNNIDPTSEFNRTILAEEYNQSLYAGDKTA